MAATLIATVGASDANSFGSLAEADAYHATVLHASAPWSGSASTTKISALIMAQQQMTAGIQWTGSPSTTTQNLPWPRSGMYTRNEVSIPDTVIPEEVKWTQFELARLLLTTDRTAEFDIGVNGITHLRAGPVTLKFKENNRGAPIIPDHIWNLLVPSWCVYVSSFERDLLRA